jgi:hypothetical protein
MISQKVAVQQAMTTIFGFFKYNVWNATVKGGSLMPIGE